MYDLLISNGQVVSPSLIVQADVAIQGEAIAGIFSPGTAPDTARRVVDATGCYVMPGGVDPHVHIGMRFGSATTRHDYRTGSIAAAHGGTTTLIDFAIQEPGTSALEVLRRRQAEAEGKAVIDYSFHSCLTVGTSETLAEMKAIVEAGVASFKLFTAYRQAALYVDDAMLFAVFEQAARLGALPLVHAENEFLVDQATQHLLRTNQCTPRFYAASRPRVAEWEAARRAIVLAKAARSAVYLVHVTCTEVLDEIAIERERGFPIYGETCPHYLTLTEAVYEGPTAFNYIMSPPLRTEKDNQALWQALKRRTLAVLASDESSWHTADKVKGKHSFDQAPPGLLGVETRLPLGFSEGVAAGRLSVNRFVEVTAANPARLFGLYPRKGIIAVGSDADLVIFNPEKEGSLDHQALHSDVGYSPYEGWRVQGFPIMTICRGAIIIENGTLVGAPGHGAFLKRAIDPAILNEPLVH